MAPARSSFSIHSGDENRRQKIKAHTANVSEISFQSLAAFAVFTFLSQPAPAQQPDTDEAAEQGSESSGTGAIISVSPRQEESGFRKERQRWTMSCW